VLLQPASLAIHDCHLPTAMSRKPKCGGEVSIIGQQADGASPD